MLYDVFISHASEDKPGFVRLLADKLKERRIEVWYDEFSLQVGDSLRQSIDQGLAKSRYGIVILSHHFFKKKWTNWELDGLLARQLNTTQGANLIIPVWHEISREEIVLYSPSLADKVALLSSLPLEELVGKIESVLNPRGSTLLIARDLLLRHGYEPPIVTDDWWLDMLDFCGRRRFLHDYLSFHVPWIDDSPEQRGTYIGKIILQKKWQDNADEKWISQLTPPEELLAFIAENPGLKEACLEYPNQVAFYLPQLTILEYFTNGNQSLKNLINRGEAEAVELARCYFVGGKVWDSDPTTRRYDMIDCVLWLLSEKSDWLPDAVKQLLITGMRLWRRWPWDKTNVGSRYKAKHYTGQFVSALEAIARGEIKQVSPAGWQDLEARFQYSIDLLDLPENVTTLKAAFFEQGFDQAYMKEYPFIAALRAQ